MPPRVNRPAPASAIDTVVLQGKTGAPADPNELLELVNNGEALGRDTEGNAASIPVASEAEPRATVGTPLEQWGGLESIAKMLVAPVQDDPVTLTMGPGYSYASEDATSAIADSVSVIHRGSEKDDRIDSTGAPFLDLFGSASQMVGANQAVRPGPTIGPTGMPGFHAFALDMATTSFEIRVRDTSGTQRFVIWVDGRPHVELETPQAFTSPGDGLYHLLHVENVPAGLREIGVETISGTFGGLRLDPRDTLLPSRYSQAPLACYIGDSFSVPAQSQWQAALSIPVQWARRLGMRLHLSGFGGTSFSNDNGTAYTYAGRYAAEVAPFAPFAVILAQGSINAESKAAGVEGAAANSFFDTLQADHPDTPIVSTAPILPTHADAAAVTEDERLRDEIVAAANDRATPIPVLDTLAEDFIRGTGKVGSPQGDGNADRYADTDGRHPSVEGATIYSRRIAAFTAQHAKPADGFVMPVVETGLAAYRTIHSAVADLVPTIAANGEIVMWENGYALLGAAGSARAAFYVNPADHALPGKTAWFRVRLMSNNGTATSSSMQGKLAIAGAPSGDPPVIAAGSNVSGSGTTTNVGGTAVNAPAVALSPDFQIGSAAVYAPKVTLYGGLGSGKYVTLRWELQVHYL